MSSDPPTSGPTRRLRLGVLAAAVLLLLVLGAIAFRQFGSDAAVAGPATGANQPAAAAADQQPESNCEEEPPPTSFVLAECDADEAAAPEKPAAPSAQP
ncbi:MAG TPA: hypothetical protein VNK41_01985 [Vicinamibacterales bacterium]|nr:hypothetical protein [Vicinamibacterales bacterium]